MRMRSYSAYLDLNDFRRKLDLEKQDLEKEHAEILAKLLKNCRIVRNLSRRKKVDEALALK